MENTTNWNDYELFQLSDINNHTVEYDGFEYWWYKTINGKKELGFIEAFDTKNKVLSYIYYNVSKWNRELFDRKNMTVKQSAMDDGRTRGQVSNKRKKTDLYNEIIDTKSEFPYLSQKRLSEHFMVSVSTIKRALRSNK